MSVCATARASTSVGPYMLRPCVCGVCQHVRVGARLHACAPQWVCTLRACVWRQPVRASMFACVRACLCVCMVCVQMCRVREHVCLASAGMCAPLCVCLSSVCVCVLGVCVPVYARVCSRVCVRALLPFMCTGRAAWRCVLWEDCDYFKWRNLPLDRTAVSTKFFLLR